MIDPKTEGDIFTVAIDLPAEERASFLKLQCGENANLRNAVQELLDLHDAETNFLETPLGDFTLTELTEHAGDEIGNYRLEEAIGEGGFGVVWRATQIKPVRREVAIKVVKLGMEFNQITERFSAERQTLAILNHPNIATVHDAGVTDSGRLYFVMELVEGPTLDDWSRDRPLSVVLETFAIICRAVQHAHQKGIIHCDLKPSNILVRSTDRESIPKVIDFGIAKAIHESPDSNAGNRPAIGTPRYMSPEQFARMPDIDTRSDIFSLGVILEQFFDCNPATEPIDIRWIIEKAQRADRSDRYQSASELANDIERFLAGLPVMAAPKSVSYEVRKFFNRNRVLVGVISIATFMLLMAFSGLILSLVHANTQMQIAKEERTVAENERKKADKQREIAQSEANESRMVSEYLKGLIRNADPQNGNPSDYLFRDHLDEIAASLGSLSDYPDVEAALRITIARAYHNLSQIAKAKEHYQRAYQIYRTQNGPTDKVTLQCQIGYASCLIRLRENIEAEAHLTEALLILDSRKASLNYVKVLTTFSRLREQQLRYAEALELATNAYEVSSKNLGETNKFTQIALNSCAVVAGKMGQKEKAESLARRALKILENHYPDRKFKIANSRYKLALILTDSNKLNEAYRAATKSGEEYVELLGETDEHSIRSLCLRSQLCLLLKNTPQAIQFAAEAVRRVDLLPATQIEIRATAYRRQAETLSLSDPKGSSAAWEEAIKFRIQHVGENLQVASHLMKHATVLEKMGHVDEALERLDQSIAILEKLERPKMLSSAKSRFESLLSKKTDAQRQ